MKHFFEPMKTLVHCYPEYLKSKKNETQKKVDITVWIVRVLRGASLYSSDVQLYAVK